MTAPVRRRSTDLGPISPQDLDHELVSRASARAPSAYGAGHRPDHARPTEHVFTNSSGDTRPAYPRAVLIFALGVISLAFPLIAPISLVLGWMGMHSTKEDGPYRRDTIMVLGYVFSIVSAIGTALMILLLFGGGLIGVIAGWFNYYAQVSG